MIIGLVGLIGSGKGTVAEYLMNRYDFQRDSFAAPVKDACAAIFGWDRELLEGETQESREFRERIDPYWSTRLKKPNFTPRLALQLMGTEAGREVFGYDLWAASCINRLSKNKDVNWVVSDTRFVNEIYMLRDIGAHIIRVSRGPDPDWFTTIAFHRRFYPTDDLQIKMIADVAGVHRSEWDWIGTEVDAHITNDATLSLLYDSIDAMIASLKEKERAQ